MTATEPWVHPSARPAGAEESPVPATAANSLRDDLMAELAKPVGLDNVTFPVRSHPGWDVVYSPQLDAELLKRWTTIQADDESMFDIALRVLAGQCRGFTRNGTPVVVDGERITFSSTFMLEATGAVEIVAAVRSFYSDDQAISDHYDKLLRAGREGLDPTGGSSAS